MDLIIGWRRGVKFPAGPAPSARFPVVKVGCLTILELGEGETASIRKLHNVGAAGRRIQSLGLFEGRRVCVIARGPFDGPLLVEDVESGSRVMIARDLAEGIEVSGAASD